MANNAIALTAHLMRRAGFGATRDELEAYASKGYEATVEELLHPEDQPTLEDEIYLRDFPEFQDRPGLEPNQIMWAYRMINSRRPLEEKVVLFWHGILCSGYTKVNNGRQMSLQMDIFRRLGLGSFRDLLKEVSRDPAMLYYLDNVDNHKGYVNENFGRELLERFSMGVGMDGRLNYTDNDVQACAQAFTGWNIAPTLPVFPYGRMDLQFLYDPGDHDDSEKTFLGQTGRWNGDDVVEIIVRQPATARFIARHLYNFFVADEPPVRTWMDAPPCDMGAVGVLEKAFVESNYDMRSVLRVLFNSEFFKSDASRFAKVKSPAELVIGTMRLIGDFKFPKPGLFPVVMEIRHMGQNLMNPPSVEGWQTGKDWITSATLMRRINFVSAQLSNIELPGLQEIVNRLSGSAAVSSPEELVDGCLDLIGPMEVTERTRQWLIDQARQSYPLSLHTDDDRSNFARTVQFILRMIAATREYQLA